MTFVRFWTSLALALCLLLSGAASAADAVTPAPTEAMLTVITPAPTVPAPAFRIGVTWEMTADDVLRARGAQSPDDYELVYGNGYRGYLFKLGTGEDALEIGYGFSGDQMAFCMFHRESESADGFGGRVAELSAEYGEPAETDSEHALALLNAVDEGSIDSHDIDAVAGWALDDRTMAYLLVMYGELYTIYLNEPLILTRHAEDTAAGETAAFVFYNAVTWDAAVGEMLAAEGAADETEYGEAALGDYRVYTFTDRQVGGKTADTAYFYNGSRLAIAGVCYDASDPDALYEQEEALRGAYGNPEDQDWAALAVTLSFLFDDQTADHTMSDLSNWVLADGTRVFLFTMDGEDLYVFYCSEPFLSAGDAAEPEAVTYPDFDFSNLTLPEETPEPETAFTFYSGVGWNSTPAQAILAEGAEDTGEYDRNTRDGFEFLEFEGREIGGETADISYVYHNGWPVAMALTYDSDLLKTYTDRQAALCARYGYPAETNANHVAKLYRALDSAYGWEDFQIVTGWILADGTCAYLLVIDNTIYNVFLHENRILNSAD